MINHSIKGLSEKTGIHRDTLRAMLNNERLGFVSKNSQWRLAKEYKWEEFETAYKNLPDDVSRILWWSALPAFDFDAAGYHAVLTVDEKKILARVRKELANGVSADEICNGEATTTHPVGPIEVPTKKDTEFLTSFKTLPKQNQEVIREAVQKLAVHWKAGRNKNPDMADLKNMFASKTELIFTDHDYSQATTMVILSVLLHQATN